MAYLHKEPIESSAATLKSLFVRIPEAGRFQIAELLDILMEPSHQRFLDKRDDVAGWVKALITTEKSFKEFCSKVSMYDKSSLCGCVWTKDFVAYRCKTCATSPCMSICADCFEGGDHTGHEYNIFRSEAGGACDCGDESVMNRTGFCVRHGLDRTIPDNVPEDLLTLPKFIMERIVIMLLHTLRYMARDDVKGPLHQVWIPSAIRETIDVLIEVIKCGSLIRSWLADLLLSEEYYEGLNANIHYGGIVTEKEKTFHALSFEYLNETKKRLPKCTVPEELSYVVKFLGKSLTYKNLLQEFTFWLCRYRFPKTLILFLLNLLPDERFKVQLSRYFVHHYIYIPPSLTSTSDVEEYSNRIVHISVQLFSNIDLAFQLAKEEYLLEIFMMSMNYMVMKSLVDSKTTDADFHQVVHVSGSGMLSNAYWAIVSDFVNCLGHHPVANLFLHNDSALKIWMKVLVCFSGMDLVTRQIGIHVEFDPENALLGFYTEREACAATLWVMLDVLQNPGSISLSKMLLELCMRTIEELLDVLGVGDKPEEDLPYHKLSFHYPVHRYFALFASNAITRQGLKLQDIELDERIARKLMAHPLQVICATHEVQSGMWVLNGLNVSTKQLAYRQSMFCTFFLDADLFMLQLCCNFMRPELFVASIFNRCRVANCLNLSAETKPIPSEKQSSIGQPTEESVPKMLEAAFNIILSVFGVHTHLGISDEEVIEQEVIAILSIQDLTHSNLTGRIPQCHDLHAGEKSKRFKQPLVSTIEKVALKIEGDAMTQTVYTLKDEYWPKYNPVFTQHRVLYKKDEQKAHTKYFKYLQRTNKISHSTLESKVWKPYQLIRFTDQRFAHLNRILNCRMLHSIIFVILYKFLQQHADVSEQCVVMSLVLLEAALYVSSSDNEDGGTQTDNLGFDETITNLFDCDNMAYNIQKTVREVQVMTEKSHPAYPAGHEEGDTDEEDEFVLALEELPDQYIAVNESILSMLIKIHEKFSDTLKSFTLPEDFIPNADPENVTVPTGASVTKRILLLAASKRKENLHAIILLRPSEDTHAMAASPVDPKINADRQRRKQKALEMQKRLLQDFALQQKKFLEQTEFPLDVNDGYMEEGSSETNTEDKHRCVICGEYEETTINATETSHESAGDVRSRIMCLIGLAQSSAVLGHRTQLGKVLSITSDGWGSKNAMGCKKANDKLVEQLKEKFPSEINKPSIGHAIGWESSPHVSTCGHHVHATCFEEYLTWVQRDGTGYLRFEDGIGFKCPVCRQTSNVVIPCNVASSNRSRNISQQHDVSVSPQKTFVDERDRLHRTVHAIKDVINSKVTVTGVSGLMFHPSNTNVGQSDEVLKACKKSLNDIHAQNETQDDTENGELTTRAMLQGQIEYNLCQLNGTLLMDERPLEINVPKRNLPIGPLFHVCAKEVSSTIRPNLEYIESLWQILTDGSFVQANAASCRLLLKNPFSLLLEICLAIYPLSIEEYQAVTQLLYNLCLVQSLIYVSCKFSADERAAWKDKTSDMLNNNYDSSNIDCLLGQVLADIPGEIFRGTSANNQPHSSSQLFTSTVWTRQSVESSVAQYCLHFLRLSALLQFHIFFNGGATQPFPCAPPGNDEFQYIVTYLGIAADCSVETDGMSPGQFTRWSRSAKFTIDQWFKDFIEAFPVFRPNALRYIWRQLHGVVTEDPTTYKLLSEHYFWNLPTLVTLPDDYTSLFGKFRDVICPACQRRIREPCLCLLCGGIVCYRGDCKNSTATEERSGAVHAKACGNGTIVLLHINRTTIVVIRGQRMCEWGTLYLDDHGEEDRGWRRGRHLTLRQRRVEILRYHWVHHLFDSVCSGWRKHRNLL